MGSMIPWNQFVSTFRWCNWSTYNWWMLSFLRSFWIRLELRTFKSYSCTMYQMIVEWKFYCQPWRNSKCSTTKVRPMQFSVSKGLFYHRKNLTNFCPKGQMISKGLFGILEFFQKTNERIRSFIFWYQKSFRNYLTFSN